MFAFTLISIISVWFGYYSVAGFWCLGLKSEPVYQLSEAHTQHMWTRYGSQDTHTSLSAVCLGHKLYLYMIHVDHEMS